MDIVSSDHRSGKEVVFMHKKPFPRFIIFAIIIYAVVNVVFLVVSNIIYINGRWTYRHSVKAMNALYTVSDEVDNVNQKVEKLISNEYETTREVAVSDIFNSLHTVDSAVEDYCSIEKANEYEEANIKLLSDAVNNYRAKVEDIVNDNGNTDASTEIADMRKTHTGTKHILNSIMFMCKKYADDRAESSRRFHIISDCSFSIMFIVGVILLILIGFNVKRREERLAAKQQEAEYQQNRANKAAQKTVDIAYTNLIMDCGNRYALQEHLDELLKNEKNFCIAKFVLGDHDALLSMISYSVMDNYMSEMSKRIKETFGNYGTLYTVSGEDFTFLFNEKITLQQAEQYAEDIKCLIGNIGSVININVSSPVFSAVTGSQPFRGKTADSLLTKLHAEYLNARKAASSKSIGISAYRS